MREGGLREREWLYHGNAGAVVEFEVWDGGVDVGHFGRVWRGDLRCLLSVPMFVLLRHWVGF